MITFVLKKAKNGKWYYTEVAKNGEPISKSQLYSTKSNARRGIRRKAKNVKVYKVYKVIKYEDKGVKKNRRAN